MSRPMKDSGMEWLGEIPENWIAIKTKFLLGKSGIKIGPFGSALKSDEISSQGPIKVYGQANLIRNDFEYGEKFIDMAKFNSLSVYEIEKEDILISMMGTIGKCSIFPPEAKRGIMDSHLTKLNLNKEKIHSEYFRYAFSGSDSTKTQLDLYSKGSIMSGLNSTIIKNILIPLPTLAEQQKIIAFLDEKTSQIDSIIENTKQSIVEFKKYKQALITETVTKGLNRDVKMKDSGIEWIGEIPEHWDMTKMKRLGSVRNGLTYSPEDIVGEGDGTLVLRSGNIQNAKLSFKDTAYVSRNINDSLYVKNGDILICSRNGSRSLIGKNAVIDTDMKATFGAFMMLFRTEELSKYIFYILNSEVFNFYLGTFLTATINQLTKNNFDNMNVVFCANPEEQQQIVSFLDEKCAHIDSLIADKEKLIGEFETYKKALIFEYITGKKEVE